MAVLRQSIEKYKWENEEKPSNRCTASSCAQEELKIKKKLVDQKYADNMAKMSRYMEKLNESIADGYSLLRTS